MQIEHEAETAYCLAHKCYAGEFTLTDLKKVSDFVRKVGICAPYYNRGAKM